MGAMFLVGLCFQWILRPSPEDKLPGLGRSEASMDKQRQPLFTPPRSRFPWRGPVVRSSTMPPTRKSTAATGGDFEPKGGREASGSDARERQPPFGAVGGERDRQQERQRPEDDDTLSESYDDDEAFILGLPGARRDDEGVWQRVTSGARRSVVDRSFESACFTKRQHVKELFSSVEPASSCRATARLMSGGEEMLTSGNIAPSGDVTVALCPKYTRRIPRVDAERIHMDFKPLKSPPLFRIACLPFRPLPDGTAKAHPNLTTRRSRPDCPLLLGC